LSLPGGFLQAVLVKLALLDHPFGCTLFELGVVFVFPRSCYAFDHPELAKAE
jgi:hypothetical protein